MVVIIEGTEWARIQAEIDQVISPKQPRFVFDYPTTFDDFMGRITQYNIFSVDNGAYIIKNAAFLAEAPLFKEMTKFLAYWIPIWEQDHQNYFFVTPKLLKNQKIKQLLADVQVITIEPISEKNKEAFIRQVAKQNGLKLDASQLAILNRQLPANADWILSEIQKIKNYDDTRNLGQILYPTGESDPFRLWETILRHDVAQMLRLWETLFTSSDPLPILALLATQMINSYLIRGALDKGMEASEITQVYKFNPYFLRLQLPLLQTWTTTALGQVIAALFEVEILVKLENIDPFLMLKFFLLKSCFKGTN